MSKLSGIDLRTIVRTIKRLKEAGYLQVHTRTTEGFKKRNSYYITPCKQNFFLLDNRFFHKGYTPKIGGFLLLLKSICLNNTDTVL